MSKRQLNNLDKILKDVKEYVDTLILDQKNPDWENYWGVTEPSEGVFRLSLYETCWATYHKGKWNLNEGETFKTSKEFYACIEKLAVDQLVYWAETVEAHLVEQDRPVTEVIDLFTKERIA